MSKEVPVEGMTPDQLSEVEKEVTILKSLDHPHIVAYYSSACPARNSAQFGAILARQLTTAHAPQVTCASSSTASTSAC